MKDRLFRFFDQAGKLADLSQMQVVKFDIACQKAVDENPDLDFNGLCIACCVYLNFIRQFPDLTL